MPDALSTALCPSANRRDRSRSSDDAKTCKVASRKLRATSTDSRGMCDGELLIEIESDALICEVLPE